jgi:hypothetical protein
VLHLCTHKEFGFCSLAPRCESVHWWLTRIVCYFQQASNVFGSRGPRKMRCYVPRVFPDNKAALFQPLSDKDGILAMVNRNETANVVQLINKPPKWNDRE